MDLVPYIFHERQEGSLCAQHALNNLLQGSYFTAIDLAEIGRNLDNQERAALENMGVNEPSTSDNFDDSGFFSIQVIIKALQIWQLEIISYNSETAQNARQNPVAQDAFICNLQEHWFTLRSFGTGTKAQSRWYNLNSLYQNPEWISKTYLSIFLTQLQTEGYSIFVVRGKLPNCPADAMASSLAEPSNQSVRSNQDSYTRSQNASTSNQDDELAAAIAASLEDENENDKSLTTAIEESYRTASRQKQ